MIIRITTGYCEGRSGDRGKSQLLHGVYVDKDHAACKLYGSIEDLQQALSIALTMEHLDGETASLIGWLQRNMFSMSSFAFLKGDSTRHQLPESLLSHLENRVALLKECVGNAPDFLIYEHPSLIALNEIRIRVREVESQLVAWKNSWEMRLFLGGPLGLLGIRWNYKTHIEDAIYSQMKIMNRMSTYFFWVSRYQGWRLGIRPAERYWNGQVEEFNIQTQGSQHNEQQQQYQRQQQQQQQHQQHCSHPHRDNHRELNWEPELQLSRIDLDLNREPALTAG